MNEFRERAIRVFGSGRMATASIREGVDPACPLVEALVSVAALDGLLAAAANADRPGRRTLEVTAEQRRGDVG